MKYLPSICLVSLLLGSTLFAGVSVQRNAFKNKRIFGIEFSGGDDLSFYGLATAVTSISLQQYQTGPYMVTEMVLDLASSPSQLRVYNTELISAQDITSRLPADAPTSVLPSTPPEPVQRLIDRGKKAVEQSAGALVVKDYPVATHAHTLEFRLEDKTTLVSLYKRVRSAYLGNSDEETKTTGSEKGPSGTTSITSNEEVLRLQGTLFKVN